MEHLNEKVDNKLPSIHSLYSLLSEAINNIDRDKEIVIPIIQNWIPRANNLDVMTKASRFDANNRPQSLKPTYILVKSLQSFQTLPDDLSRKITELVKNFNDWGNTLLPDIIDEKGEIRTLQQWQDQASKVINNQIKIICDDSDYDLLVNCMDKIIGTNSFLESFERDANQVAVKYLPYSTKVKEVIDFDWPSDEEYQRWVAKYLNDDE